MSSAYERRNGFTVLELLVVIVVVGILATLAAIGLAAVQANGRDEQRNASAITITEALEKYYDEHGEYPSCPALTAAPGSVASVLKIDQSALKLPRTTIDNAIICSDITSATTTDSIAYLGDGSATCNTGSSCLVYTLKYKEEATGAIISLKSRREAAISTSGVIDLQATNVDFTAIDLEWNAIQNTTGYVFQRASNATFTSGLVQSTPAGTTRTESGLTTGAIYYFRVRPQAASGDGAWSNTVVARTATYAPTGLTATANSTTQITASWSTVSGATSYRLEHSTSSAFTSPAVITGITGTSRAVTGLTPGTTYYFRVFSVVGSDASAASTSASATTSINAPVPTATTASATQINLSWPAVSGAESYTLNRSTTSAFSTNISTPNITTTSYSVTGLSQGTPYYFRLYTRGVDATSDVSSVVSATTSINTPSAPSVSYTSYDASQYAMRFDWTASTCPTGTTAGYQYQYYRDGDGWQTNWIATTATNATNYGAYDGYTNSIRVQQRCVKGSVVSSWSGSSTAESLVNVSNPTSTSLSWQSYSSSSGAFVWSASCRVGAAPLYSSNFWIANATFPNGVSGWLGPDYPYNDYYDTSMGISSTTPGSAGDDRMAAKVRFQCYNSATGRRSGTVVLQTGQHGY